MPDRAAYSQRLCDGARSRLRRALLGGLVTWEGGSTVRVPGVHLGCRHAVWRFKRQMVKWWGQRSELLPRSERCPMQMPVTGRTFVINAADCQPCYHH